jgi:hypothetical protein
MRRAEELAEHTVIFAVPGDYRYLLKSGSIGDQYNPTPGARSPAEVAAVLQACEFIVAVRMS